MPLPNDDREQGNKGLAVLYKRDAAPDRLFIHCSAWPFSGAKRADIPQKKV